jgi:hypothetical protein
MSFMSFFGLVCLGVNFILYGTSDLLAVDNNNLSQPAESYESAHGQELGHLEGCLDIKRLDSGKVIVRFPFCEGDQSRVDIASRGLRELAGCLDPDIPLLDHQVSDQPLPSMGTLTLTKRDYMSTQGWRECSDNLIELWWHWWVVCVYYFLQMLLPIQKWP